MKILKQTLFFLTLSTVVLSCGSDDDPVTLDVSDFTTTVDENQAADAVLGTVAATGTDGTFAYSIASQSPSGSIAIDGATGQITVADASAFDFETNPTITAIINVMGNSITESANVTITLNDKDDMEFLLTDSQSAYTAANNGDWVAVTETEYNNLASNLNNVSIVGTSETLYSADEGNSNTNAWTVANDTGANVPENSYVFAFKYYINSGTDVTGFKVKQSETIDDGYADLGNALPTHSGNEESVYFILKGNSTILNDEGYVAFYKPSGTNLGISTGENYYFVNNDVNTGFTQFSGYAHYQGLSTTQKQW